MLMSNDSHPSGLDVASYTIEEIDSITSEYTLKNTVSCFYSFIHSPYYVFVVTKMVNLNLLLKTLGNVIAILLWCSRS